MRKRSLLGVLACLLCLFVLLACCVGCKNHKDVYGAASDFIKVSHPETPNKNAFSDDEYDTSSDKSSNPGDATSSDAATSNSAGENSGDKSEDSSSAEDTNPGDKPFGMDIGPIVLFD